MGPKHHFCSNNGSRMLPNTCRLYKNKSLQSITTPRYYCNVIISNVRDIRKPYPLFRPQNDIKISVFTSNVSETRVEGLKTPNFKKMYLKWYNCVATHLTTLFIYGIIVLLFISPLYLYMV